MCLTPVKDNACGRKEFQNGAVKTFLYLHPEIKLAEFFSDQKFIKLLKQGKTECKERVNDNQSTLFNAEYKIQWMIVGRINPKYSPLKERLIKIGS